MSLRVSGEMASKAAKRIPLIKFPNRLKGSLEGLTSSSATSSSAPPSAPAPAVPAAAAEATEIQSMPSSSQALGGRALDQPSRTRLSEKEIESILLGGLK